ncbi:hypothetical protein MXB_4853 [Myxobolus squamalis]|nr:hypothetical protein MXB_4853 [Myxobolus squamalis]
MFHAFCVALHLYYERPSVVLSNQNPDGSLYIIDDFRQAYYWLNQNTDPKSKVMSWWDYGYQITGMANRTTIVDNNTWNNSHIALVGRAMASNESAAYSILRSLEVDYVLVIFGGVIGFSGDDINKFLWMVRISQGEFPRHISEPDYFSEEGAYTIGKDVSDTMKNSLMYKMCYYNFAKIRLSYQHPTGYDTVRREEIGHKHFNLDTLEEAFTSSHWIVRIYKVKKPANRCNAKNKIIWAAS